MVTVTLFPVALLSPATTTLLRFSVLPNLSVRPRLPRLAVVLTMSMIEMGTGLVVTPVVCPCAMPIIPVSLCTSLGSARR